MSRSVLTAVVLLSTLGLSGVASAGGKDTFEVRIFTDASGGTAMGCLGDARHSADQFQVLECQLFRDGGPVQLSCTAEDSTRRGVSCTSTDPVLIDMSHAINGDSCLWFRWDVNQHCVGLQVQNSSRFTPK
jgi:hypothetical protein